MESTDWGHQMRNSPRSWNSNSPWKGRPHGGMRNKTLPHSRPSMISQPSLRNRFKSGLTPQKYFGSNTPWISNHRIGSRLFAMILSSTRTAEHPTEEIQKWQFLKALKKPLRSLFALLDFSIVPLTEDRALNLDLQNIGTKLALFQGLRGSSSQPTIKETQFRKVFQCTLCL